MLKRTVYLVYIACDGCGFKDLSPLQWPLWTVGGWELVPGPQQPLPYLQQLLPLRNRRLQNHGAGGVEVRLRTARPQAASDFYPPSTLCWDSPFIHLPISFRHDDGVKQKKTNTASCTFHCDVHCEQVIHELLHSSVYWRGETSTSLVAVDRFLVGPLLWVWELDFGTCWSCSTFRVVSECQTASHYYPSAPTRWCTSVVHVPTTNCWKLKLYSSRLMNRFLAEGSTCTFSQIQAAFIRRLVIPVT